MTSPSDYQVLLESMIMTAKRAAIRTSAKSDEQSKALSFAYCDVLDAVMDEAKVLGVPLADIGLESFDPHALVTSQKAA